jgi:hypothetical protein
VVQKGVVEVTLFRGYKGGTEGGSRSNFIYRLQGWYRRG